MDQTPISVSDALALINQTLDYAFPVLVIEGEVASFKVNQGKFVFFDVKDDGGTLGCFMMLFQLRQPLEDGMRVQVVATPKLTNWGKFSLTVREVRPVGEGSLKRAFELLQARLEKEGLFALERKRLLPTVPQRVAVVSSVQAAGYADFLRILDERWGGLEVEVANIQVQGAAAPKQMIRAIEYFNQQEVPADALVIIRGGGSADDLAAFNDEPLVRAISASRIPTLVGVGHEVDTTLADLVADVRAATPSHAATILVPDKQEIAREARGLASKTALLLLQHIETNRQLVRTWVEAAAVRIDTEHDRLKNQVSELRSMLSAYNPEAVLRRGYAVVRGQVAPGKIISIERINDTITAEVTHVEKH